MRRTLAVAPYFRLPRVYYRSGCRRRSRRSGSCDHAPLPRVEREGRVV